MFGDKVRNSFDIRAELRQIFGEFFVGKLFYPKLIRRAFECAAQAVERQFAVG
jgi:hypothetical protein